MRRISKTGTGGYHLGLAHKSPPSTSKEATSRWGSFGYKPAVLQQLLEEQYQLCCYSEIRPDQLGLHYHIEHVENKSQAPHRTFDYQNLAACSLDSENDLPEFGRQRWEVFGGHTAGKQANCDMHRFVGCHQPDCARFFAYLSDGRVVPSEDLDEQEQARARYTIDLLNLNSPYLITARQNWWDELDKLIEEHLTNDWSLLHLAAVDLVPSNHALSPFFSITRQFFGQVAETVLQQNAPQLL